jgi:hypothetical protein
MRLWYGKPSCAARRLSISRSALAMRILQRSYDKVCLLSTSLGLRAATSCFHLVFVLS